MLRRGGEARDVYTSGGLWPFFRLMGLEAASPTEWFVPRQSYHQTRSSSIFRLVRTPKTCKSYDLMPSSSILFVVLADSLTSPGSLLPDARQSEELLGGWKHRSLSWFNTPHFLTYENTPGVLPIILFVDFFAGQGNVGPGCWLGLVGKRVGRFVLLRLPISFQKQEGQRSL